VKSQNGYIDTADIPQGYVSVPLTVDDNGKTFETELFAGHMAVSSNNNSSSSSTIEPRLDFCLLLKNETDDEEEEDSW
jgi:hypothetical protein